MNRNKDEQEIRDILAAPEHGRGDRNYSIVAGAGAGKTSLLSSRICHQISQGVPLESFAVITYTNAATAELRKKIADKLSESLEQNPPEAEAKRIRLALHNLELMQISTIHSFLLKLLQESAFDAGVALDAELWEADQNRAESLIPYFEKWYTDHYNDLDFVREDWNDHAQKAIENLFYDLVELRESVVIDRRDFNTDWQEVSEAFLEKWFPPVEALVRVLERPELFPLKKSDKQAAPKSKATERFEDKVGECRENLDRAEDPKKTALILCEALRDFKGLSENKVKNDGGIRFFNYQSESVSEHQQAAEDILIMMDADPGWDFEERYNCWRVNRLVAFMEPVCRAYQAQADHEARHLSNNEILYRAYRLLRNHPETLDKIRRRYSKIYVDEFQDTTRLQTEILKMLCGEGVSDTYADFSADKLVIVGDPKQSIYRFIGAEKILFEELSRDMDQSPRGETITLRYNFRSHKEIVDFVNERFSRRMGADYDPMTTDWVIADKRAFSGVFRLAYSKDMKEEDALADLVLRLLEKPCYFLEERVWERDPATGEKKEKRIKRPLRPSDFMVLTLDAKEKLLSRARALEIRGISVSLEGKYTAKDLAYVGNFVSILEHLSNPKNELYYYGALQIVCRRAWRDTVPRSGRQRTLREEFHQATEKLMALRDNPGSLVYRLIEREDLFFPARQETDWGTLRKHRMQLYQMVDSCLNGFQGSLADLVMAMRQYLDRELKGQTPLERGEDALRLMNLHQAKGLTANIVMIAQRDKGRVPAAGAFREKGAYYPAVHYTYPNTTLLSYPQESSLYQHCMEEEEAEAVRKEYVAATRAAQALIFLEGKSEKAWFSHQDYDIESLPEIYEWMKQQKEAEPLKGETALNKSPVLLRKEDLRAARKALDPASLKTLEQPACMSLSPSDLESKCAWLDKLQTQKEERPKGNDFGTVMHRCFELMTDGFGNLMALQGEKKAKAMEELIWQALAENEEELHSGSDPQAFRDFLHPLLLSYLESFLAPVMADAQAVYPEYAFSFHVVGEEKETFLDRLGEYMEKKKISTQAESYWINGKADLVVLQKDGRVKVFDYKSDTRDGAPQEQFARGLQERYAGQLALYAYALEKSFGAKTVETQLVDLYREDGA